MNRMKKLASLVLALVMALALAVPAMAAENTNVTISRGKNDTHKYSIYQIFTGDVSTDGTTLSNVKWGENGTGTKGDSVDKDTLDDLTRVANAATDREKLDVIEQYVNLTGTVFKTLERDQDSVSVPTGYYLIKDEGKAEDGESISLYVVELADNVTITLKRSTTTLEKKVKDDADKGNEVSDWQDSADYDIGDTIPFQLTATLCENVEDYETYYVSFVDTLSDGLTLHTTGITVTIDGEDRTTGFTIVPDGQNLTVTCNNVKALGATNNSVIVVSYTAELNERAVTGTAGNPNTAHLEYSRDPNTNGDGTPGKTPEDTVVVFTFKGVVNKFDDEGKRLSGAEFTLYKKDAAGEWAPVAAPVKSEEGTTFTFNGLDDGLYKLAETTTPDGYNTMEPVYFMIVAEHDIDDANPQLTEFHVYACNENGIVTGDLNGELPVWGEADLGTGTVENNITNNKGTILPETGGIGTTIFYVLGGLLTLGAVVLLVTKKRMSLEEK